MMSLFSRLRYALRYHYNLSISVFPDLNECKLRTDNCTSEQYCTNTAGSFKCIDCHKSCQGCTGSSSAKCMSCAEGFYQDDETCVGNYDIDSEG